MTGALQSLVSLFGGDVLEGQRLDAPSGRAQVFAASYARGSWLERSWGHGASVHEALTHAIARVADGHGWGDVTSLVVVVPTDRIPLTVANQAREISDHHRGVRGVGIQDGGRFLLASPTECIARNLSPSILLQRLAEDAGKDPRLLLERGLAFAFGTRQFHVALGANPRLSEMLRCNRVVPVDGVSQSAVRQFELRLSDWMLNNVHDDGRMTYRYFPSRCVEDLQNDNMVRQAMATVCLGRIAKRRADAANATEVAARVQANRSYFVDHFYRQTGELGWIEHEGTAYLGSAALALIALDEASTEGQYGTERAALMAATQQLLRPDGSFHMFFKPRHRTEGQNFFPGETLLAWCLRYRRQPSEALLELILRAYRFYRAWHLRNRNPAFVPWHTQAYYQLLQVRPDPEMLAWVFEMNDWLLGMQTHSTVAYPDTVGRFFDPNRRYGPPHASSTGVYLEGLIDAFELARAVGDVERAQTYKRSIVLGLRSALQLQFVDELDMFYVADRRWVAGGLRTTVYNNRIRVDNVQHVLMAVQKIVDAFRPDDYVIDP